MTHKIHHYHWQWNLRSTPEALWPWVSDTNRFNRDTGLPQIQEKPPRPGSSLPRLSFDLLGMTVEWEEEPFEWVYPRRFGVLRRYSKGPLGEIRVLAELEAQKGSGTQLTYQLWAQAANVAGSLLIPLMFGVVSPPRFGAAFQAYDRLAAQGKTTVEITGLYFPSLLMQRPAANVRPAFARQRAWLQEQGVAGELLDHLEGLLENADELTLSQIRPYVLAEQWNASPRAALEMCLLATRAGLLELRWQLLCPVCRVAKDSAASLSEVNPSVHCETCQIDYSVNFDRSVEVIFRPNPIVRAVNDTVQFCIGGPHSRPHVVIQQQLEPGESRQVGATLLPGRYRLRAQAQRGGQFLQAAPGGAAQAAVQVDPAGWPQDELQVGLQPILELTNRTPHRQLLILERFEWGDYAVTAADVTTLQTFRDLFSSEALRADVQISVGSLSLVFTDLCDSTRMYRQIGDAPAFGKVMDHFDVLKSAIAAEGGAVVKTMGDAVMAVFQQPAAALRAMFNAQQRLAAGSPPEAALRLKVGIHHGPCIAVTMNERLDYFGSVVNIASRLTHLAEGGEIIVSQSVTDDPAAGAWLDKQAGKLHIEHFQAQVKGFDEVFELQRLRIAAP